jgi:D-alanyl-D-alanine carboxypeptidase
MHMQQSALRRIGEARGAASIIATLVVILAFCVAVPAASADSSPPALNAFHAFVGDPLFGFGAPGGTLFGIKPDEQSAMASTTKLWTLDLTAQALSQGVVHLDDLVTINPYEASLSASNSLMTDVNGKTLEAGEVVKLRDLIRGMIYQSGNDAALAIARTVAQGYLGPAADFYSFVTMMNAHAAALGQMNTHFTSPVGWDNPAHYTSARDLADELQHGLQDPFFAKVVGFKGYYTAMTQGPNGPKTYKFNWGRSYPGWEGEKGGSTTNCNGPNNGFCLAVAATRIGRRVVASGMQLGGTDATDMLDYGFDQIFHPDPRGSSTGAGLVSRQALDCFGSNRAVTANLPPTGPVSLALWNANVDSSTVTKLTEAALPGSGNTPRNAGDVAVTRLPSGAIILATRTGAAVQLSRWTIARDGTLLLLASGISAGNATTMGLQPVYGDMFLTTMTDPNGDLVVKSWQLQGTGLALLDTYTDHPYNAKYTEVAVAGPLTTDILSGHRAVTDVRDSTAHGTFAVWGVDPATGKITRLNFAYAGTDIDSQVTVTPLFVTPNFEGEFPPVYYAVSWRDVNGDLKLQYYRIGQSGTPDNETAPFNTDTLSANAGPGQRVRLAPLGTGGLISAVTDGSGHVGLTAWETNRNNGAIQPGLVDMVGLAPVSEHDAPDATSLSLCRLPGAVHAEGDYVTATRDLDGQLRVRAYRSGDRPY